ncbi:hypothetical protein AGABI1DRAFT_126245 [Agaricus bisporus var. burnettii JB137-S8]|uniref:Uncharacterized protein n=1 Tax=Agaricus bisporus var. burnettii (strain JB137-S8 / ATCC MYA-4627 / FGSC 10392) TaxID=597362 RepID=K5W503_AGABU|nr:uncharacterized protein AGABI1DRAFT_126245 [Agaricus bisporus var. burnettii JB137-S8]EKM81889.1 hypothetical protein AGABI1DRAFT_126245 [Agaricus bisporus var. burnettii JB137-S8]
MGKYKSTSQKKKEKAQCKEDVARQVLVFQSVQRDPIFCDLLLRTVSADGEYAAVYHIFKHHWLDGTLKPEQTGEVFGVLLAWAGEDATKPNLSKMFRDAISKRHGTQEEYHRNKCMLLNEALLNAGVFDRKEFLWGLLSCFICRLSTPYPPPHKYAAENGDVAARNFKFVYDCSLPDQRISRKYMFNIDISKLSYDVDVDESIILEDGDGPFLVVIRNACK